MTLHKSSLLVVSGLLMSMTGCATRPTAAVLNPAGTPTTAASEATEVTILAATNRAAGSDGGYDGSRVGKLTFERYRISTPPERKPGEITYPGSPPDQEKQFTVTARTEIDRGRLSADAVSGQWDGTVAVFVHGYNYSYQESLFRLAQIVADGQSKAVPVMFSWPSQASVASYLSDRDASLASRDALVSLLDDLAAAPQVRHILLLGHSMGGFLVMEAARQLKLAGKTNVIDKLVIVLAAPDIDADLFGSQMTTIGRTREPVTLLVSKDDKALKLSSLLAGERPRVGSFDPDDPAARFAATTFGVRVIDITSLRDGSAFGHDRFASLPQYASQLASLRDQRSPFFRPGIFTLQVRSGHIR